MLYFFSIKKKYCSKEERGNRRKGEKKKDKLLIMDELLTKRQGMFVCTERWRGILDSDGEGTKK